MLGRLPAGAGASDDGQQGLGAEHRLTPVQGSCELGVGLAPLQASTWARRSPAHASPHNFQKTPYLLPSRASRHMLLPLLLLLLLLLLILTRSSISQDAGSTVSARRARTLQRRSRV